MDLRISSSNVGAARVVALDGVADLAAVPMLHTALTRASSDLHGIRTVVVDLDGLTLLDDVAIGLLVGGAARVRTAGGELVLVCNNDRVCERLQATRVDRIVRVAASIVDAVDRGGRDAWTPSGSSATN